MTISLKKSLRHAACGPLRQYLSHCNACAREGAKKEKRIASRPRDRGREHCNLERGENSVRARSRPALSLRRAAAESCGAAPCGEFRRGARLSALRNGRP